MFRDQTKLKKKKKRKDVLTVVGYLFTLLESYERGRKKDKRRKKDHYFLTSLFSKNSDRRIKRDERIKEKKKARYSIMDTIVESLSSYVID